MNNLLLEYNDEQINVEEYMHNLINQKQESIKDLLINYKDREKLLFVLESLKNNQLNEKISKELSTALDFWNFINNKFKLNNWNNNSNLTESLNNSSKIIYEKLLTILQYLNTDELNINSLNSTISKLWNQELIINDELQNWQEIKNFEDFANIYIKIIQELENIWDKKIIVSENKVGDLQFIKKVNDKMINVDFLNNVNEVLLDNPKPYSNLSMEKFNEIYNELLKLWYKLYISINMNDENFIITLHKNITQ